MPTPPQDRRGDPRQTQAAEATPREQDQEGILLSFILCSRNDDYMGSPRWRLQSALNYLARSAEEVGCQNRLEVVVADWGSDIPLRAAIVLSVQAARLTRFLEIPPSVAEDARGDSPFPEALALNCALRRCRGRFVARIDQDTLISQRFFQAFLRLLEGRSLVKFSMDRSFLFMPRRSIPYGIAARYPALSELSDIIDAFWRFMPIEGRGASPWFDAPTGVALASRRMWLECGGYDERLRYWGFMETNLALRLGMRYEIVDMGKLVGCHVYHLEHTKRWFDRTTRRKNPRRLDAVFYPNTTRWGLAGHWFPLIPGVANEHVFEVSVRGTGGKLSRLGIVSAILQKNFQECILAGSRHLLSVARRHPSEVAEHFHRSG
jgi:hypothetical protein